MTPTSATGARRRRTGFTLVELMVVVTIIGLLSAAVVVALPDGRPSVADEAERFGARLTRAREEAVLTNRTVQAEVDERGYSFRVLRLGEWRPLERPFDSVAWGAGVKAVVGEPSDPVRDSDVPARIGFDPTGLTDPATVTLSRDGRRARVSVDAAGAVRLDAPR